MSDEPKRLVITAEQAIALLPEGEYIHNIANPAGGMLIGCDFSRDGAIEALRDAIEIEIGGEQCKAMKHPIVVWETENRCTFFAADMGKVEALESEPQPA